MNQLIIIFILIIALGVLNMAYRPWSYHNYLKNKKKPTKHFKAPEGVPQDLWDTYRTLADQADKRMKRLEELATSGDELYKSVRDWAYLSAAEMIHQWDGDKPRDLPRWARNHPTNAEDVAAKLQDIIKFLEMQTSTKSGINEGYKRRADSLNAEFETDFTWQEWARFGIRGLWDRNDSRVSYRELIRIGSEQKQMKRLLKPYKSMLSKKNLGKSALDEIKKEFGLTSKELDLLSKAKNTIFEGNKGIVMKHAENFMKENGLTYDTMFK